MKYLKKFNEELYTDDEFDDIKTISYDELEEWEKSRESDMYKNDINYLFIVDKNYEEFDNLIKEIKNG